MQKFWEGRSTLYEEPQQDSGPVFIPNEGAIASDRRDEVRTGIAVEGNDRAGRQEGREASKDERDGVAKMRDAFLALPEVKKYNTIVSQADAALHTEATPAGDQRLMYSIVQMRDPLGSVREGDAALLEGGVPYVEQQLQKLRKNLNAEGMFPDEYRKQLKQEAVKSLNTANRAYTQYRRFYTDIANQSNYDPYLVVGPHAGTPYLERFREYDRANGLGEGSPGAAETERGDGPLGVGPAALPLARGAHEQGGTEIDGVSSKGTGFRPEPQLYHLGNEVAERIRAGQSAADIAAYLDEQYAPYGVAAGAPMQAKINEIIKLHQQNPSAPIKSLAPGWDSFHLIPDNAEPTIVGDIADSPVGAGLLGVADIGTLGFGDEIAGAIGGDELNAAWDYSRQERPKSYMAGQLAGAFLLPSGAASTARNAGTQALRSGSSMTAARTAAASAGAKRMGAEAGAFGAVHGFGAAEGGIEDRLAGSATEAALGYVAGRGVGALGGKVAQNARSRPAAASTPASEYAAAAGRLDVEPYAPDMGMRTAAMAGKLAQTQAGLGPIKTKAAATLASAKAARDRIARTLGKPQEGEGLGYTISNGAQKAIAREHDKGEALYKAAERQSDGARIRPTEAFQTLSDEIDAMADTGLSETAANIFKRVRDRMAEGPMTVDTLRSIRSSIREDLATMNVRGGVSNARAQRVMEAITKDIDDGLRAQGRGDAADLFKQADGQWASYIDLTDNVVTPLIGKDASASGEQVVKRLTADLQGNNARAVKLLNALPAKEQSIARASVIQALGRSSSGRQDAAGEAFSLNEFLTQWDKIGETAKRAYFGKEGRAALNDLAVIAQGSKAAQRFANHSNTGGALNAPIGTLTSIATLGLSSLATNVTARMLTSQRMVRWLAGAAKKPNAAAQSAHIERLSALAKAEPALANDILGLQTVLRQQLSGAAQRTPASAYAEEEKGNPIEAKPAEGERHDPQ